MPETRDDPTAHLRRLERGLKLPGKPREENDLSKMLRVWRALAGVSQTEASRMLDVDQRSISMIENGYTPPPEIEARIRDLIGAPKQR